MAILKRVVEPYASMQGLHLFHFGPSNCSQRVRITLEEKGVNWTSHVVNLPANDHLKPEYQRLHPKGVVPALVHDGRVVVESNDIIRYLEQQFPDPQLYPERRDEQLQVNQLIELSSSVQMPLKLLSYTYFFGSRMKKTAEQLREYDRLQQNKDLVSWQKKFSNDEFSREEMNEAVLSLKSAFMRLETILEERAWLSGGQFGLADISWIVNVYRATQIEDSNPGLLGLKGFPQLTEWLDRVSSRESFIRGLKAYEVNLS